MIPGEAEGSHKLMGVGTCILQLNLLPHHPLPVNNAGLTGCRGLQRPSSN